MSGLEKIIEHIQNDAAKTSADIRESTVHEAEKILAAAQKEADSKADAIRRQSQLDVVTAANRLNSAAEQRQKRMVLEAKQKEIEKIFEATLDTLDAMDPDSYFAIILKMIPKYAQPADGEIKFSKRDLERLPAGFEARMNEALGGRAALTVSREEMKIRGGFILDYGDIEENCSFEAMIEASRETLQDRIGQVLFRN